MKASEKDRLYRVLENKICERIFRGEYADGENLPPERTLAESLGVSRVTVRKALALLEAAEQVRPHLVLLGNAAAQHPQVIGVAPLTQLDGMLSFRGMMQPQRAGRLLALPKFVNAVRLWKKSHNL